MCHSGNGYPHTADSEALTESVAYWRTRFEDAQADVSRLASRLRGRDQRILLLERALARTAALHHVLEDSLEQRLEQCSGPTEHAVDLDRRSQVSSDNAGSSVMVRLPHLTRTLSLLFEVMWEHWAQWDPERPPKSSTVARTIDAKLGLKGQADGEASRNAQSFAAALRPDSLGDADGRHR
ncbi:hypothetical protein A8H39_18800 [Paraburkholderia fungorum]|uniref:hypothetical protein n=1 Tax=Paraburkholderia fungorum TaxID=134537 RepID=UPI0004AB7585|nr:hypothetical protein [Paraburkholderia fungorum]KFX63313.1 hypothetical protein KBK24_0116385 [Burkholderia sp. K24]MBB5542421.1 hypothetical protein [Paraburkholderia fungorum]PNE57680.1 hypothetical protein A8H39_18800 [Paraburkholderia fungorum]